jgi:hypothetical protein
MSRFAFTYEDPEYVRDEDLDLPETDCEDTEEIEDYYGA